MKKILFVCVENSCRSQMAQGFAGRYGKNTVKAYSAGSKPSGKINPEAIAVMKEDDIDITEQRSKGFDDLPVKDFDLAVTMGCGDVCPFIPARAHMTWNIDDPKGKPREYFRKVRDQIEEKVKRLISEIAAAEAMKTMGDK